MFKQEEIWKTKFEAASGQGKANGSDGEHSASVQGEQANFV